jgi:lysine-specific histone demethylase 1B
MKRRKFISLMGLSGASFLLANELLISSCSKEGSIKKPKYDGKVIVVGGGAAGIYAAYLMELYGIEYQLLEANERLGGRLGKETQFCDFPIDRGAQWMHGKNNIISDWIRNQHFSMTLDDTEATYWYMNQLVPNLPKDPYIFEEEGLPDVSFKEYAHSQGFGAEYDYIIENIAGDQGAAAAFISAYWNAQDEINWSSGEDDYKFSGTYYDVFQPMIDSIASNVQCNKAVTSIDYSSDKIQLTAIDGSYFTCDKVIVTVPITQLKKKAISFLPALPSEKLDAIGRVGMDPGMKVFLKFSEQFFHDNIIGGEVCAAYANEKIGKTGNDNVLLAFIMGDQAATLSALGSDELIIQELLNELETMYPGKALSNYLDGIVFNWTTHPYIEGAYSYSTVGQGDVRKIIAEPIQNKVFFAGEATNFNGHHQTVFGAAETGYRELMNIIYSSGS